MKTYDVVWKRVDEPDTVLSCKGLDPRTLVARLINATSHGEVIVVSVTPNFKLDSAISALSLTS